MQMPVDVDFEVVGSDFTVWKTAFETLSTEA